MGPGTLRGRARGVGHRDAGGGLLTPSEESVVDIRFMLSLNKKCTPCPLA